MRSRFPGAAPVTPTDGGDGPVYEATALARKLRLQGASETGAVCAAARSLAVDPVDVARVLGWRGALQDLSRGTVARAHRRWR